MMSGKAVQPATTTTGEPDDSKVDSHGAAGDIQDTQRDGDSSDTIRIKRTYNFAGRVHTEEKVVARDSAEAKLYLASQGQDAAPLDVSPTKRATKKAFRSAFEPIVDAGPGRTDLNLGVTARLQAAKEAQAKKLNTVEKSRMDWAGFVDKEGIQDELELASKSKGSYGAREAFLARSEAIREDEARRARMAARAWWDRITVIGVSDDTTGSLDFNCVQYQDYLERTQTSCLELSYSSPATNADFAICEQGGEISLAI